MARESKKENKNKVGYEHLTEDDTESDESDGGGGGGLDLVKAVERNSTKNADVSDARQPS